MSCRQFLQFVLAIFFCFQVFHAIVRSKLLYGLETLQLSVADQNRIIGFQTKGYRRILHIPPTSIDRTKTNEFVTTTLTTQHQVHVRKFSDLWLQRKITLLGHIIRSDPSDPMRQVLFEIGTLTPRVEFKKRVGKRRIQWLPTKMHIGTWDIIPLLILKTQYTEQ